MDACVLSQQKVLAPHLQIYTQQRGTKHAQDENAAPHIMFARTNKPAAAMCACAYALSALTNFTEIAVILFSRRWVKSVCSSLGGSGLDVCVLALKVCMLLTFMFHISRDSTFCLTQLEKGRKAKSKKSTFIQ
jgi:hypothetical protein